MKLLSFTYLLLSVSTLLTTLPISAHAQTAAPKVTLQTGTAGQIERVAPARPTLATTLLLTKATLSEEVRLRSKLSPSATAQLRQVGTRVRPRLGASDGSPLSSEAMTQITQAEVKRVYLNSSDGDIMALAFLVLMQATRDAQEDLNAIMKRVKEINDAKQTLRAQINKQNELRKDRTVLAPSSTPTPKPPVSIVRISKPNPSVPLQTTISEEARLAAAAEKATQDQKNAEARLRRLKDAVEKMLGQRSTVRRGRESMTR